MGMIEADTTTGFSAGVAKVPVALGSLRRRLLSLVEGLDHAAWGHPSRCQLWTVHDVIRHVRDAAQLHVTWLHRVEAAELQQPFDAGRAPRLWLERTAGERPDETIAQLRHLCGEEATALSSRLDEGGDDMVTGPYGQVHWTILSAHVLWDAWVHVRDVAEPLGVDARSTPVEDDVVALYALLIASVPALVTRHSFQATVDLSTPDGGLRSASVAPGHVTLSSGGAPTQAELRGDLAAVVDALAGRGPEVAAVLHGDPAAREALTWLRPVLAGNPS